MAEYIEKEAAIRAVSENDCEGYATWAIKAVPAADVRENVRARWIDIGDHLLCSGCGATHYGADKNFCPNCGAQMGGADGGT